MTLILVNTLGWLIVQLSIAAIAVRMDPIWFANDYRLYGVHEREIKFYKQCLHIRRWKGLLPDGATWVGGRFRKKSLQEMNPAYLRQLAIETKRGEIAHWLMLASFPIFFLWNPPWARIVVMSYAIAANLPCILVQRYNREAMRRLLLRRNACSRSN
jgi:glycosyl-4,4'-diaponeurosporenoate acyltransferase